MLRFAILAASAPGPPAGAGVETTEVWTDVLQPFATAMAVFLLVFLVFRMMSQVLSGAVWKSRTSWEALGCVMLAAVLWNLDHVFGLIGVGAAVLRTGVESVLQLISG